MKKQMVLALFQVSAVPIPASREQPVPHMGWNDLAVKQASPLTDGLDGQAVYFVHSYFRMSLSNTLMLLQIIVLRYQP